MSALRSIFGENCQTVLSYFHNALSPPSLHPLSPSSFFTVCFRGLNKYLAWSLKELGSRAKLSQAHFRLSGFTMVTANGCQGMGGGRHQSHLVAVKRAPPRPPRVHRILRARAFSWHNKDILFMETCYCPVSGQFPNAGMFKISEILLRIVQYLNVFMGVL